MKSKSDTKKRGMRNAECGMGKVDLKDIPLTPPSKGDNAATLQVLVGPSCRQCGCKQAEVIEKKRGGGVEYERRRCSYCQAEYVVETSEEAELGRAEVRANECPVCHDHRILVRKTERIGDLVVRTWKCGNEICGHGFKTVRDK